MTGTSGDSNNSLLDTPESTHSTQALSQHPSGPPKRTRVLLSCAPCRVSKLKCDRQQPCGHCTRRGRIDGCAYAPRPQKSRPARSMAARLKRLEGMVREMMDPDESPQRQYQSEQQEQQPGAEGGDFQRGRARVVMGKGATTYVGATHFMAMLDDIEDLKSYFDDEEDPGEQSPNSQESQSPEIMLLPRGGRMDRQDILDVLPQRHIVDRLVQRYFTANSPSQHTVHRPTFVRQYNEFWLDPDKTPLDWVALLLLVLALGTFFSTFQAPHELENDSDVPPMERFRRYRAAAGWALVHSKYTCPGPMTLQPLLLYVEGEFLVNRAYQTTCYLLSSVCIRLMLKMGLHRDPSKLPNISPFDGEMRRRWWNLAIQIDLIVSFHMGLPSMIHGIESDTNLPRNLMDEDLSEDCAELPPSRPSSEYTSLTYPIWKSTICRIFGLVARQAHSLTLPTYNEVMKLDWILEDKWKQVPPFMVIKPLEDSITDPPSLINQRFGLGALYQKSRCVLHRRYLVEAAPKKEHAYSRRTCLEAALALLDYQSIIYQATLPGGMLRQNGWFITALAIHDFLIAAMIIYIICQNDNYSEVGENNGWVEPGTPLPNKEELRNKLRRSHRIWKTVAQDTPVVRKAAEILETMLRKTQVTNNLQNRQDVGRNIDATAFNNTRLEPITTPRLSMGSSSVIAGPAEQPQAAFSRNDLVPQPMPGPVVDTPWLELGTDLCEMDWTTFDTAIRGDNNGGPETGDDWMQQEPAAMNDLDFMAPGFWGSSK
ncbi:fungal-specific transcription factor domain-containing protein [Diplogelasinospora grovesii]|uniref:Fungal-specific transcription factor domain-containing protein n=1 Tax=Diplogelasinospora grovesii TaxID=303347 RepID=A0AAN6NE88_9PEZI|nr:fungal-specific transcription factor domain-containing protein [Diplogelasinospora grovesii]